MTMKALPIGQGTRADYLRGYEPEDASELPIIVVRSNLPPRPSFEQGRERFGNPAAQHGAQVALYERHPAHPGGQVMVFDDKPARVARTPRVEEKLRAQEIVEVTTDEE
jgi:hypothetical protein